MQSTTRQSEPKDQPLPLKRTATSTETGAGLRRELGGTGQLEDLNTTGRSSSSAQISRRRFSQNKLGPFLCFTCTHKYPMNPMYPTIPMYSDDTVRGTTENVAFVIRRLKCECHPKQGTAAEDQLFESLPSQLERSEAARSTHRSWIRRKTMCVGGDRRSPGGEGGKGK